MSRLPRRRHMKLSLVIAFALTALVAPPARAQWTADPVIESHIQRGIHFVHDLSFDSAKGEFNQITKAEPDQPVGYFLLATVEWWRIAVDPDNKNYDERFHSLLDKVVDLSEAQLKKNDHDVAALFFKGGGLGYRGRLHALRSDWVQAAKSGQEALSIVQEAHRLAPDNYDILFGVGVYDYYAEVIPELYPVVKPLMIFFPKGDKRRGLDELRKAAQDGKYAKTEAAFFLAQILVNHEKQFDEAAAIAAKLHQEFPHNVLYHRYLGRAYAGAARSADVRTTYTEVLDRAHQHAYGYNQSVEREAEYYIGQEDMNDGKLDSALSHFYRCDELSRAVDADQPAGFMVMTNLKIGMIYDKMSKRDDAIKQYNKVLKMTDYLDAHDLARRYLKTPYGKS